MKIFDCTTFYDENFILDLRFNILDKFLTGQSKLETKEKGDLPLVR